MATNSTSKTTDLRLVVIIKKVQGHDIQILIEINKDRNVKHIGPFLRGSNARFLSQRLRDEDRALFSLIESVSNGPPYKLPLSALSHQKIISKLLESKTIVFLQKVRHGSLIRVTYTDLTQLFSPYLKRDEIQKKPFIGELRLSLESTFAEIRFRYEGLPSAVRWVPDPIPIPTPNGHFIIRDLKTEKEFLNDLGPKWNGNSEFIPLDLSDLEWLTLLPSHRWVVLTPEGKKLHTVSSHFVSGINWFSSETDEHDIEYEKAKYEAIVDAYLRSRGYVYFKGELIITPNNIFHNNPKKMLGYVAGTKASLQIINKFSSINVKDSPNVTPQDLHSRGFVGALRDYQLDGLNWLLHLRQMGIGGLLADEMGLGKTVQLIAYFAMIDTDELHLIISPATVIPNWQNELVKFMPPFKSNFVHRLQDINEHSQFLIMSYEAARRAENDLMAITFDTVILDEAQKVKNERTQTAYVLNRIRSRQRFVLTGTPIENSLVELWSHASFLNPSLRGFHNQLARRFESWPNSIEAAKASKSLLGNILLRRTKDQVSLELPPKIEKIEYCELSDNERGLYDTIRRTFLNALKGGKAARVSSLALQALLRLRQCCAMPTMLPSELNFNNISYSTKLEVAWSLILDSYQSGRKLILFTQFLPVLDAIEERLKTHEIGYSRLDGSTRDREIPIKLFQEDPSIRILIISLKAGGFGVNITAADRVLLYDPWWNPAVEDQAIARAHRIGRADSVLVQRLICPNTVEEKILELQQTKLSISSAAYSGSDKIFDIKDILQILKEDGKE